MLHAVTVIIVAGIAAYVARQTDTASSTHVTSPEANTDTFSYAPLRTGRYYPLSPRSENFFENEVGCTLEGEGPGPTRRYLPPVVDLETRSSNLNWLDEAYGDTKQHAASLAAGRDAAAHIDSDNRFQNVFVNIFKRMHNKHVTLSGTYAFISGLLTQIERDNVLHSAANAGVCTNLNEQAALRALNALLKGIEALLRKYPEVNKRWPKNILTPELPIEPLNIACLLYEKETDECEGAHKTEFYKDTIESFHKENPHVSPQMYDDQRALFAHWLKILDESAVSYRGLTNKQFTTAKEYERPIYLSVDVQAAISAMKDAMHSTPCHWMYKQFGYANEQIKDAKNRICDLWKITSSSTSRAPTPPISDKNASWPYLKR